MTAKRPRSRAQHSLLARQIRRIYGDSSEVPSELVPFLAVVDEAYRQFDTDRVMLERSLELSSRELLEANRDLGAVVEDFVDVFFRLDANGIILDCRGGDSCLMLPVEELVGQPIQGIPYPEIGKRFADAITSVQDSGAMVSFQYQLPLSRSATYFEAHLVPLRHAQLVVIIRNVTEVKQAQLRERALHRRLERYKRMESLGMLAGGVAHDLNNILGPLVAYPELILARVRHDPAVLRDVLEIKASAKRAAAVIQDLLILARRGGYQAVAVRANDVIRSYLDSAAFRELRARRPEVYFQQELEIGCPPILGTEHNLAQLVMNLIVNAHEAVTGEGSVSVSTRTVELRAPHTGFERIEEGRYLLLSVRDSGQGIRADHLEHIFEPFFTTKKLGRSGSGLGLAVVYGIMQDCGGFIDVLRPKTGGTEFQLYLPLASKRPAAPSTQVDDLRGTEHVLVVDDVPGNRTLAARLLECLGYEVATAHNGRAAVEFLRSTRTDLVLLDMIMEEEFDGLDTYRHMVRIQPDIRCVIATGYAETDRVRKTLRLGASACIRKPYDLRTLGRAVRASLDGRPIKT
jgi:signal transduction histidine kinase/CheY-like chemotaxis protein